MRPRRELQQPQDHPKARLVRGGRPGHHSRVTPLQNDWFPWHGAAWARVPRRAAARGRASGRDRGPGREERGGPVPRAGAVPAPPDAARGTTGLAGRGRPVLGPSSGGTTARPVRIPTRRADRASTGLRDRLVQPVAAADPRIQLRGRSPLHATDRIPHQEPGDPGLYPKAITWYYWDPLTPIAAVSLDGAPGPVYYTVPALEPVSSPARSRSSGYRRHLASGRSRRAVVAAARLGGTAGVGRVEGRPGLPETEHYQQVRGPVGGRRPGRFERQLLLPQVHRGLHVRRLALLASSYKQIPEGGSNTKIWAGSTCWSNEWDSLGPPLYTCPDVSASNPGPSIA